KADDDDSALVVPPGLVPYKPLVMMKSALLTLDVNKGYSATVKVVFAGKDATDDGETALKSALYVIRELVTTLPKMEGNFRPLAPLSEPVEKALKAAKLSRKGNTLEVSASLTVSA